MASRIAVPEKKMRPIAVVTGGTSGIGAAFAEALAKSGHDLIIVGRREEIIRGVAKSIEVKFENTVEVRIVDLGVQEEREALVAEVARLGNIELLVNNAGFGHSADFGGEESKAQLEMLDVHVTASVNLISAVLPGMKRRKRGAIINVASVAGFFPMPRGSMYSATKAFLVSLSESLSMELSGHGIRVQALCPGMTHTDFHAQMGVAGRELQQRKLLVWMSAEKVVRRSLNALSRNRVVCIPGVAYYIIVRLFSHTPRWIYYPLLRRLR